MHFYRLSILLLLTGLLGGCTKQETIEIDGNQPPVIKSISTLKIKNYINRIYIDLLGREPLDDELAAELLLLQTNKLSLEARENLITRLQTDTSYVAGDSSYRKAYYINLYNLAKVRCLEGASDDAIREIRGPIAFASLQDSLNGDWESYAKHKKEVSKLDALLQVPADMEKGLLPFHELFGRMVNNAVYDVINMNTFNFVRATFDNLLWRFPTEMEFSAGFNMIEFNKTGILFNQVGSNRDDYVQIVTNSQEMFEGMIIWAYRQLLARSPASQETSALLKDFILHKDIRIVQKKIMVSDEYANFY